MDEKIVKDSQGLAKDLVNDCISRQAAIDALFELYEYQRDIDPTEAADLVRQGIFLAEKKIEKLPSAQPYTDEEIQKMQDIEQAQLDKAYEMGKADAMRWIPCSERLPKINQIVLLSTNSNNVYVGYRNKPELLWQVEEDGRKQWVYDPESYDVDIDVLPKTEDIDFYCEGVNDGGFLSITSANYNDRFEGVTAWMSLPEPYKEDKQG